MKLFAMKGTPFYFCKYLLFRHATRVKNPVGQVVLCGDNVSPLVEIRLTDLPKSGGAAAPPASHLAACLLDFTRFFEVCSIWARY